MDAQLEKALKDILAENIWLFLGGFVLVLFKSTLEKFAASLFVFFGNDYNEDDIVIVDGRHGRIVRVGFLKTTFFLYEMKDGIVHGGTKLVVQNEKLASMNIEKPLGKID